MISRCSGIWKLMWTAMSEDESLNGSNYNKHIRNYWIKNISFLAFWLTLYNFSSITSPQFFNVETRREKLSERRLLLLLNYKIILTNEKIMFMDKWVVSSSRFEMNKLSFNLTWTFIATQKCLFFWGVFLCSRRKFSILSFSLWLIPSIIREQEKKKWKAKEICVKNRRFCLAWQCFASWHFRSGKGTSGWYSLVGLNIIYRANIDFSWIEKHKKTLRSDFPSPSSSFAKDAAKKKFNKFLKCSRAKEEFLRVEIRPHKFCIQFCLRLNLLWNFSSSLLNAYFFPNNELIKLVVRRARTMTKWWLLNGKYRSWSFKTNF